MSVDYDTAYKNMLAFITAVFESSLELTEEEEKEVEEMLPKELTPEELEKVRELTTSWHRKGSKQGKQEILLKQLNKRFGSLSLEVEERIKSLSVEELDLLAERVFELSDERDLRSFLNMETVMSSQQVVFFVEEVPEEGYIARALGHSIFVQGENLEQIRGAVRDAVCCHFENKDMPRTIRLRIVKDEVMTV